MFAVKHKSLASLLFTSFSGGGTTYEGVQGMGLAWHRKGTSLSLTPEVPCSLMTRVHLGAAEARSLRA